MPHVEPDTATRQADIERRWNAPPPPAAKAWARRQQPLSDRPYGGLAQQMQQALSIRRAALAAHIAATDARLMNGAAQLLAWRAAAMRALADGSNGP